jgi:hypothetical protein
VFKICEGCGKGKDFDCPFYICKDKLGFLVICCIVYAVNNDLFILGRVNDLLGNGENDE